MADWHVMAEMEGGILDKKFADMLGIVRFVHSCM